MLKSNSQNNIEFGNFRKFKQFTYAENNLMSIKQVNL